jgi:cell division protein FtsB
VRGRKKNAFENLEQEVEYIRKENSQLQLINAKLETENKSLKDQIEFMKTLIKPVARTELVEDYLSSEVLTHPSPQQSNMSEEPE